MILPLLLALALPGTPAARRAAADSTATLLVHLRHDAAPVSGASVSWGPHTVISDVRGIARLIAPVSTQAINITRLGFADTTVAVSLRSDTTNSITVQLREVALEAEAVVVSATRSGTVVSQQPIRVETVPTEEIEENLSAAPGNLSTLLEELPGVRVAPAVPGLGGAGLQLRGLPARMTSVLIDALPLLGTEPDAFSLLQAPPLDLARVEVLKGVASALYGGAATAGVLNLVSKNSRSDSQLLLNRSSRAETDGAAFLAHQFAPHWGATLTASANGQQRQDLDRDGWSEIPFYERVLARPRLFWNAGSTQSVLATGGFTHETRRGGSAFHPEALTTMRADGGGVAHLLLKNSALLGIRTAYTHQQQDRTLGTTTDQDRLNVFMAEATLSGSSGSHDWVVGGAFDYDALRAASNPGFDYAYHTPALFAQDEILVSDRVSATASARFDFIHEFGTFFSPRAAALLRVTPSFSLRLSGGTGWDAPRPVTERLQSIGHARVLPLSGLRPERVRSASLDADWHIASMLEASVGTFANDVVHPLSDRIVQTQGGGMLQLYNMPAPQRTRGVESLLHLHFGLLQLLGSYTYLYASKPDSLGRRVWQEQLPKHSGELGAILEDEHSGRVGMEVGYTGRMRLEDDPYRTTSAPYWEVNFLAAKYFHESELFVNALNLLNARQSDFEPLLRRAPSPLGEIATPVWGPLTGRVFNIGLRLEL